MEAAQQGPVPLDPDDLVRANGNLEALPARWVTIPVAKIHDPGLRIAHYYKRVKTGTTKVLLLEVGGRLLLADARLADRFGGNVTGFVVRCSPQDKDGVFQEVMRQFPAARDRLLLFRLDTYRDVAGQPKWLYGVAAMFGLPGLFVVVVGATGWTCGNHLRRAPEGWRCGWSGAPTSGR